MEGTPATNHPCLQLYEATGFLPFYLMYGRHPRLPADMIFGLTTDEGADSPRGYAEKWASRMKEAYRIAPENSASPEHLIVYYYDQCAKGVVLEPGDRVLVHNFSERGGPGKLRPYWENNVHVVRERTADGPIYKVSSETDDNKIQTLHRNLLHLVNELPVDLPQQLSASTSKKRGTYPDTDLFNPKTNTPVQNKESVEAKGGQ